MANNNYAGFNYGGTQYNTGQVSYPAVTNATYANAAAYQNAAVAAGQGGYAAAGAGAGSGAAAGGGYGSGGGGGGYGDYRSAMQSYDASKTFYQQAPASYNTSATAAAAVSKTHYSAPPVKNPVKSGGGKMDKSNGTAPKTPSANPTAGNYSGYDTALYNAASMYVAQQHQSGVGGGGVGGAPQKPNGGSNNWYQRKMGMGPAFPGAAALRGLRPKAPPRPQQLHYCEVCKISCAGPQTYREHLEGQKHKKREASLKMQASATTTTQNRGNNYHCELCDVTCTGTDAYAAHVRGAKHQKVVKLHQKLGKPIPSDEPKKLGKINFVPAAGEAGAAAAATGTAAAGGAASKTEGNTSGGNGDSESATGTDNLDDQLDDSLGENTDNIKPVGGEYIEEVKDEEGKILSFNCKLCDCKFNDPNAKEMHMKGRRHRLQYKRKVQPDLVVDFKPTPRQRRLAEARAQRALMSSHRGGGGGGGGGGDDHESGGNYWEEQRNRQYNEEYDYNNWMSRSFGGAQRFGRMGNGPPPHFGMMPGGNVRRPESTDDRHAIARHAEIYPKEEELQTIQRIVSHTERALKLVSDALTEQPNDTGPAAKKEKTDKPSEKDGRDNQIFSFHKDADNGGNIVRILKGVMRVGYLAKGLLLHGDSAVELVVLCAEKPTAGLLQRVANVLPDKLKEVAGDIQVNYRVEVNAEDAAVIVLDDAVSVKITLTSPLLREANPAEIAAAAAAAAASTADAEFLPREPCLRALADLRHAKWFQARATGLQSCVMVIRILRDLCQRVVSWQALPQWSLELLVEKVISSAGFPISPGDCMRRIMEALASGFLINGPGLLDPCEKDPTDALQELTKQEREDLTVSAQLFLRYIAFRQIFKVLGMDQLPAMKFPMRPWRINRKRRRSSGKAGVGGGEAESADIDETGSDEKVAKKEGGTGGVSATAGSAAAAGGVAA